MHGGHSGIVLSGGGARGAYEAGIIRGLIDVLGLRASDGPPFTIFTGTSVGAINATFSAANVDRGDLNAEQLVHLWCNLSLETHLRFDPLRLTGVPQQIRRWLRLASGVDGLGQSLLDPAPLDAVVRDAIPWSRLHAHAAEGRLRALIIAALRIADGRTTIFAELDPRMDFNPTRDPRRRAVRGSITPMHVLASAAIPLIFPARRVADGWYCDGGLRFNTPIAPAIRAGAERLLVVSLQHRASVVPDHVPDRVYPDPIFLIGKVLNALLLDPVTYDLQVLGRFNKMVEVLEDTLDGPARAKVDKVLSETRGMPYRKLETLVFSPSEDLGQIAGRHLRGRSIPEIGRLGTWLLRRAAGRDATWEVDLASYLLFDGQFAARLIEVGHRDAVQRADEVKAFFGA
ncbi:MAG: patatin-like phospholipase family protein [Myxococcales bacterium]|nr:patatin-like phospholipase family protein [Myxococcales bacterium]